MGIPVGALEVWFQYQLAGDAEAMYTHLAYELSGVPSQAAVDAGFTAWQLAFRSHASSGMNLAGGHVLIGDSGGSIRFDSSITGIVGTGTGTLVPQNTAYIIRKTTASGGRRNRGRMYVPGVLEGVVSEAGVLAGATITALNASAATLKPGGAVHTAFGFLGDPVILHDSGSQTPTPITDLGAQLLVGTQRRRLRR